MKRFAIGFLLLASAVSAQEQKTCVLWAKVAGVIQREHYRPKPIDDSLSAYVFDRFIDVLDEDRNLFTKSEYNRLCRYRLELDDALLGGDCSFLDSMSVVYEHALLRKRSIISGISEGSLDYSGRDTLRFSREGFPFDLQASQMENLWRKRLAFETLQEISKRSQKLDSLQQHFSEMEPPAFRKVRDNQLCKIDNILHSPTGFLQDLQSDFLDTYCSYFDPHTNYFFQDAKSSFLSAISTSNLSFGLEFGLNEDNEITVEEVLPGGPAAETKKIDKDDVIVKVTDKDGHEYVVSCTGIDSIGAMIYSDQNREIKFTVRKKNGALLDVSLQKQVMKDAENSVYGFVLGDKAKTGYIRVPGFYTDFEGHSGHGVAEDVAAEIKRLEKEHVGGLVIDLQDNGGGSMDEAVKMAGMFIGRVPVAISRDRFDNRNILRERNARQLYEGPVVVLINGNSASATEFFTAAIQDYHRGIVAGARSLGKASVQVILPVDDSQQEFVKTTIQKFYRVTGLSGQRKGIVPDVFFPTLYDSLVPRETSEKQALAYDSIPRRAPYQPLDVDFSGVVRESRARIGQNVRFSHIAALEKRINKLYGEKLPPLPIRLEPVFSKMDEVNQLWGQIKAETQLPTNLVVSMTRDEDRRARHDRLQREIDAGRIKTVASSPAIQEAANIIDDLKTLRQP